MHLADGGQKMVSAVIQKFIRFGLLVAVVPDRAAGQLRHLVAIGHVVKRPGAGGPALVGGRHDDVVLGQDRLDRAVGGELDGQPIRSHVQLRVDDMNMVEVLDKIGLVVKKCRSVRKNLQDLARRSRRVGPGAAQSRGFEQRPSTRVSTLLEMRRRWLVSRKRKPSPCTQTLVVGVKSTIGPASQARWPGLSMWHSGASPINCTSLDGPLRKLSSGTA
jgi:hypothetical protein